MRTIIAALILACTAAHADDVKIAVVDMQRALNEVEEGAAARKALKKEFDEKQKQLDVRQTELKTLKDDLDARGSMMKPEVKDEKVKDIYKKLQDTQQLYVQLQQELSKREGEATQEIFKKMSVILQVMGEEQGYSLVIEKTAAIYAKPALDITNEVIRRYNDAYGKKKPTASKQSK